MLQAVAFGRFDNTDRTSVATFRDSFVVGNVILKGSACNSELLYPFGRAPELPVFFKALRSLPPYDNPAPRNFKMTILVFLGDVFGDLKTSSLVCGRASLTFDDLTIAGGNTSLGDGTIDEIV